MRTAEDLYAIVAAYADLGDHRSGTPVDRATTAWLADLLTGTGAATTVTPFPLPLYDAAARVTVRGRHLLCEPLPFTVEGTVRTSRVARAALDVVGAGELDGLEQAWARAVRESAEVLLVATRTEHGGSTGLTALNRRPQDHPDPVPTLLVAAEEAELLLGGAPADVVLQGRTGPGEGANVVARWGPVHDQPLVVTTSLNGWYRCAGERGTGLAVALDLAQVLAAEGPVELVLTGGHELEALGLLGHLARRTSVPRGVVHVGASAAACGTVPGALSAHVRVASDALAVPGVAAGCAATGHAVHDVTDVGWRGEAGLWSAWARDRGARVPLVSVAGASPVFHTVEDVLPAATTPALLAQVRDGLLAAGRALLVG